MHAWPVFSLGAVGMGHIEFQEHIQQLNILRFMAQFTVFYAKGAGHVGFAAAGSAGDRHVKARWCVI